MEAESFSLAPKLNSSTNAQLWHTVLLLYSVYYRLIKITDMELELIDFLAQLVNDQKARQQGYTASTRWLCTREDLKDECKQEALKEFEEWKEDELRAKKSRDEMNAKIKYVGVVN